MDKQEKYLNKDTLITKVSFLQEMIAEKTEQFNLMIDVLKRYEAHAAGSKDIVEKFSNYVKKQQSDVEALKAQQKLTTDISNFVNAVLEGTKACVRSICGDVEKVYFSKQGELLFLQQEIEKLIKQKLTLETSIGALEEEVIKEQEQKSLDVDATTADEPKKKKRVRPDQDPTTRVGRAALDLAERRRRHQKKSP
jgi:multidrug efflux pump subunit AcrA (membrane-fusion protein)